MVKPLLQRRVQVKWWLAASLSLLGLMWTGTAIAATPAATENMTVSPTRVKAELAPGTTKQGEVTLINDGDTDYDFKVYTAPYRVTGEDYHPQFVTEPGGPDVARWVQVPPTTFHMEPRQSLKIPYTVAVPAGTPSGGYYATLFYETVPKPSAGSGVQSKERIGVVTYIRVPGALREAGGIASFTARLFQKGDPVRATLRLSNTGNVHYTADVRLVATDLFGQRKADIQVSREVLPGTVRRFELAWERTPPLGLFRLGGTVGLLGRSEPLPAQYVLVLEPIAAWLMLGALVALAIIGLWGWLVRRRGGVAKRD